MEKHFIRLQFRFYYIVVHCYIHQLLPNIAIKLKKSLTLSINNLYFLKTYCHTMSNVINCFRKT